MNDAFACSHPIHRARLNFNRTAYAVAVKNRTFKKIS